MNDGHLFLSAHGGVDYVGDSRHAWYDETHGSVLVLSPRSRKLRQIALLHPSTTTEEEQSTELLRGRSYGDESEDEANEDDSFSRRRADGRTQQSCGVSVVYEFVEPSKTTSKHNSIPTQPVGDHPYQQQPQFALIKLSVDKQFLAIQTSDIEVQVIRLATREKFWILCQSKAGNRILHDGLVWNTHSTAPGSSQDLFLITKLGIEQYRVSAKRRNCALHRRMGIYIHTFWYAASHGTLIISSGSRANELVVYLLRHTNVEKLPRLVFSTPVSKNDLFLASLYGELYAVYGDTRSTKLLLYLVGKTKVACVRSLNLLLPPGTSLEYSVVDNLLICHSVDFNVSLFFDVKCDGNVSDPFSHPLPISLHPPQEEESMDISGHSTVSSSADLDQQFQVHMNTTLDDLDAESVEIEGEETELVFNSPRHSVIRRARSASNVKMQRHHEETTISMLNSSQSPPLTKHKRHLDRATSSMTLGKMDHHQYEANGHYFSRWRFLYPNLVQRSFTVKGRKDLLEHVEVRKLQINLREICRSCAHHREVFPFLLRRGDQQRAKELVLELMYDRLAEQEASLPAIVQMLACVQTVSPQEIDEGSEESANDTSSDDDDSVRRVRSSTGLSNPLFDPLRVAPAPSLTYVRRAEKAEQSVMIPRRYRNRNEYGFLLIFQSEFFHYVWKRLLPDSEIAKNGGLSVYICEFIKILKQGFVPVETVTFVGLAQAFLAAGNPDKLYQFLQYHIPTDSMELADLLVHHGQCHPSLMQAGLDMYFRLGAITPLVRTLLDSGDTDRAIAISWRNMGVASYDASVVPAVAFYDSLIKSLYSTHHSLSTVEITQKFVKLLIFLKIWDSTALDCSTASSMSTLAKTASLPFPDHLLTPSASVKLRRSFGFAPAG